ncbi:MAG: potassium channel family protein [Ilumatobacteraceae bacterium]
MADNINDLKHDPDFQRHTYRVLAASAILLITVGTGIFSLLEDWSIVDSFYFSVVTATTVGFGDLTPDTDAAKLFTVIYIVVGISIIGTFLDARFKKVAYQREHRIERRNEPDS